MGSDSKDYSFLNFINGLQTITIEDLPYNDLKTAFEQLNFSDIWEQVGDIWENVDGLFSFFEAVGYSFKGVWDSIIQIGQMMYYTVTFSVKFFGWLFNNLIEIIKFIFTYIFVS